MKIWFEWFFYNADIPLTLFLLLSMMVFFSIQANMPKLVYFSIFATAVVLLFVLGNGIFNLIQAPRCPSCNILLPLNWDTELCEKCRIEVAASHYWQMSHSYLWK